MLYLIHGRKGRQSASRLEAKRSRHGLGFSSEGSAMTRLPIILLISIASLILLPPPAQACSVPVFKYALAYWQADLYEVIVFHRGPLSLEGQAAVNRIQKASWNADLRANVAVKTVDLTGSPGIVMQKLWEVQPDSELPCMVVRYPKFSGISDDVWAGRFTAANVESLLNSPVRKEIVRRILDGEAAVWVLLESGAQEQDEAAASLLEAQLKRMTENLKIKLPEGSQEQLHRIDPRVSFSMMRLSRDDPNERIFAQMLLRSEWDLKVTLSPMAFPIFGRGRALYALVGEGIRESNIEIACSFLAGWCSCVIKEQNPGVDLLMSVNWDDVIPEELYEEAMLLLQASETVTGTGENAGTLKRNIIIVILIQILVVIIVTCLMLQKRKQKA